MLQKRMTSESRRRQILDVARLCFSRDGFTGTTTKHLAESAGISEGLLFKHFPTKAALYAEVLAESCEANPTLIRLSGLEPSTTTLVAFVRDMVHHFLTGGRSLETDEQQKLRLLVSSHLGDGNFASLLFGKIEKLLGSIFAASLERAIAAGDANPISTDLLRPFWFAHNLLYAFALVRLPALPSLAYPTDRNLERQLCDFILRGIGLSEAAIAANLNPELSTNSVLFPTITPNGANAWAVEFRDHASGGD